MILIIYRLKDGWDNKHTLSVILKKDKTLGYSFYSSWQPEGTPQALSNLMLKMELPVNTRLFRSVKKLAEAITFVLETGHDRIDHIDIIGQDFDLPDSNSLELTVSEAIAMLNDLPSNQKITLKI